MHFEQLDSDTFSMILRNIEQNASKTISSWKTTIPLLHVNKRWRSLACPFVCKNAFIEVADTDSCEQQNIATNLSFVCTSNFYRYIRKLTIKTSFETNVVWFYNCLSMLLLQYKDKLYKTVSIYLENTSWREYDADCIQEARLVSRLKKILRHTMPNIKNLSLNKWELGHITEHVYEMLISIYADQLGTLEMKDITALQQSHSLTQLTSLNVGLIEYENMNHILRISAASLVDLKLNMIPHTFLWGCFGGDNDCDLQTIEFTRLKTLRVWFRLDGYDEPAPSKRGYTLHFPKLMVFYIDYMPTDIRFIENCVFPQSIDTVVFNGSSTINASMLKHNKALPKTERLVLHSASDIIGDIVISSSKENRSINNFIEKYHGCKETILHYGSSDEFYVDRHVGRLSRLSAIYMSTCESIKTVVDAIKNAPYLRFLEVILIPSKAFQDADIDIGRLPTNLNDVFDTKIKNLNLYLAWPSGDIDAKFVSFTHYLVLRIPSLRKIRVHDYYLKQIDAIIQKHKNKYPHLGSICLSD